MTHWRSIINKLTPYLLVILIGTIDHLKKEPQKRQIIPPTELDRIFHLVFVGQRLYPEIMQQFLDILYSVLVVIGQEVFDVDAGLSGDFRVQENVE